MLVLICYGWLILASANLAATVSLKKRNRKLFWCAKYVLCRVCVRLFKGRLESAKTFAFLAPPSDSSVARHSNSVRPTSKILNRWRYLNFSASEVSFITLVRTSFRTKPDKLWSTKSENFTTTQTLSSEGNHCVSLVHDDFSFIARWKHFCSGASLACYSAIETILFFLELFVLFFLCGT